MEVANTSTPPTTSLVAVEVATLVVVRRAVVESVDMEVKVGERESWEPVGGAEGEGKVESVGEAVGRGELALEAEEEPEAVATPPYPRPPPPPPPLLKVGVIEVVRVPPLALRLPKMGVSEGREVAVTVGTGEVPLVEVIALDGVGVREGTRVERGVLEEEGEGVEVRVTKGVEESEALLVEEESDPPGLCVPATPVNVGETVERGERVEETDTKDEPVPPPPRISSSSVVVV